MQEDWHIFEYGSAYRFCFIGHICTQSWVVGSA